VVHEFFDYECPACRSSHKKLRRLLSSRSDRLRVVRHDMSRVECIGENGNLLKDQCISQKAAYCAGAQNQFWEFNPFQLFVFV
jgi:protein-disulfide isomerase